MKTILPALRLFIILSILTGVLYPLAVTGLAQWWFPRQANGSLVSQGQTVVGSELLAQAFKNPRYFWPRPSAGNFATVPSGGSNYGPTSGALQKAIRDRASALRAAHELPTDAPVPPELLTASGSGLDPHISPEAARFELNRVARERGFDAKHTAQGAALISRFTEAPQWGFLGQPRVNVLLLNLALDRLQ
jgi:potassium-transporting ATPase KdpC subunit